jgi:hypothetical protein
MKTTIQISLFFLEIASLACVLLFIAAVAP